MMNSLATCNNCDKPALWLIECGVLKAYQTKCSLALLVCRLRVKNSYLPALMKRTTLKIQGIPYSLKHFFELRDAMVLTVLALPFI